MPAVILDFASAVPAYGNGEPHSVENLGIPLREIKKAVMGWIQFSSPRKGPLHRDRDPVAELHADVFKVGSKPEAPARKDVNKKRTPWLQDPDALGEPLLAPFQVIAVVLAVGPPVVVLLANVERRIGKDGVDRVFPDVGQQLQAIALEKDPSRSHQIRFHLLKIPPTPDRHEPSVHRLIACAYLRLPRSADARGAGRWRFSISLLTE